jgi:hypothetical protein
MTETTKPEVPVFNGDVIAALTTPRIALDDCHHLRNILRRIKDELRENKLVNAFDQVRVLESYLEKILYD